MSTFRVGFDGHWQEDFDSFDEAVEWAQQVSSTGRIASVVERRAGVIAFGPPSMRNEPRRRRGPGGVGVVGPTWWGI